MLFWRKVSAMPLDVGASFWPFRDSGRIVLPEWPRKRSLGPPTIMPAKIGADARQSGGKRGSPINPAKSYACLVGDAVCGELVSGENSHRYANLWEFLGVFGVR